MSNRLGRVFEHRTVDRLPTDAIILAEGAIMNLPPPEIPGEVIVVYRDSRGMTGMRIEKATEQRQEQASEKIHLFEMGIETSGIPEKLRSGLSTVKTFSTKSSGQGLLTTKDNWAEETGKTLAQQSLDRIAEGLRASLPSKNPETTSRPSWDETFMSLARTWATRSTCPRLAVGCILVDADHQVISSGYNGSPRGLPHCLDVGCEVEGSGKAEHCVRAIHAETNAIIQAARVGISVKGATIYTTHLPCRRCGNLLIQAGVKEVVFEKPYGPFKQTFALFDSKVNFSCAMYYRCFPDPGYLWGTAEDGPGE